MDAEQTQPAEPEQPGGPDSGTPSEDRGEVDVEARESQGEGETPQPRHGTDDGRSDAQFRRELEDEAVQLESGAPPAWRTAPVGPPPDDDGNPVQETL
jgi:hypothetical protein